MPARPDAAAAAAVDEELMAGLTTMFDNWSWL